MKKTCIMLAVVLAFISITAGCEYVDISGEKNLSASDISSAEIIPHKFGKSDLTVRDSVTLGMTEDAVKQQLGQPDGEETFNQGEFIYGKHTVMKYGDMSLTFFDVNGGDDFTLGIINTTSGSDKFTGGLHVGSSVEEVLAVFTKSDEANPLYFKETEESYGDYIYGSFNRDEFVEKKPTGEIQYAYINKWNVNNGYGDEYTMEYYYCEPLVWNEDETQYSGNCYSLIFYVDNQSGLVKSISLNYDFLN